jgi:signal transduction histidine kinase/CheY-like chemotaxis protein/ligand-binding sensor domain-containing protein
MKLLNLVRAAALIAISAMWRLASGAPVDWVHPDYIVGGLDIKDGLPANVVSSIARDPHGDLWITSFQGLGRYDGFEVVTYDDEPSRPEGNQFFDQAWDAYGTLWLFGGNRLATGYREGRVQAADDNRKQAPGPVSAHRLDEQGRLWLATDAAVFRHVENRFEPVCALRAGVYVWDIAPLPDGSAVLATEQHGVLLCAAATAAAMPGLETATGPIQSVYAWQNALWLLDQRGLHRFDYANLKTVFAQPPSHSPLFRAGRIEAQAGRLWARTNNVVLEVTGDAVRTVIETAPAGGWIRNFVRVDRYGAVWIAHGTSLYRDGSEILRLGVRITGMDIDIGQALWVASAGRGIYHLRPRVGTVFQQQPLLREANLYAVIESRQQPGRILMGGLASGLLELEQDVVRRRADAAAEFDPDTVWTLLEDRQGRIWQGGLFLCIRTNDDRCDNSIMPPELGPTPPPRHDVRMLLRDRDDAIWIGSGAGLYRFAGGVFRRIDDAPSAIVRAGLQRADGSLWFGTNDAGIRIWRNGRLWPLQGVLASQKIRSFHEDAQGILWVGTDDRGLLRLQVDAALNILDQRVFGSAEGLWDNAIHYIAEDPQGRLWMNSNRGIFWIERDRLNAYRFGGDETLPVVGYDESDGLLNREGNGGSPNAGMTDSRGGIWFVGQSGAIRIDPARIPPPPGQPAPHILAAGASDSVLSEHPAATTLGPRHRELTVRYSAPVFHHSERARFRYRLAGFEQKWTDAGNRREAFYTNLPPGEFTFELKAANGYGEWSTDTTTLAVTVLPRYYERLWFSALIALLLLVSGAAFYRWRVAQLHRRSARLEQQIAERTRELLQEKRVTEKALDDLAVQAEKLREVDAAKSRFFTNISHELRTPLTLVVGPAQQAMELLHRSNTEEALKRLHSIRQNGQQLLTLVNQILELARLDAGYHTLKPAMSDLALVCRQILERFLPLASVRNVTLIGPAAGSACVCAFDADALNTIVGNLTGNAIRHSPDGSAVRVRLQGVTGGLVLSVTDQGPGIPPESIERVFDRFYTAQHEGAGSGIGLALARELAHLHGGDLTVHSVPGKGCVFELVLPLEPITWVAEEADTIRDVLPRTSDDLDDGASDTRKVILVVDDVDDVRDYVASCLMPQFTVISARHGAEALIVARRELPDMIVSDVMMPELDGLEMAQALARSPATSAIPVILLTARSGETDQISGLSSGAVDYLTKPFAPEILVARVKRLLGFANRLREQLRTELADRARLSAIQKSEPSLADRLHQVVLGRLDDTALDVEDLAHAVHMSRSRLKRRMKEDGLPPPSEYIRDTRLRMAAELLQRKRGSVTEIAYAVGFVSLSHFSHRFRDRYGVTPSAYTIEGDGPVD